MSSGAGPGRESGSLWKGIVSTLKLGGEGISAGLSSWWVSESLESTQMSSFQFLLFSINPQTFTWDTCEFHLGYNCAAYRIKSIHTPAAWLRDIFRAVLEDLWFSVPWTENLESTHQPFSSAQFSRSVMSDSVTPWTAARKPPCPSPTPGVYPNPCPSSQWCHPTVSSSVVAFSSRPQSFPASGSFPVSQLFASGGQSIGASASASVLPMNTQDWTPLRWTGWISLQSSPYYDLIVPIPSRNPTVAVSILLKVFPANKHFIPENCNYFAIALWELLVFHFSLAHLPLTRVLSRVKRTISSWNYWKYISKGSTSILEHLSEVCPFSD